MLTGAGSKKLYTLQQSSEVLSPLSPSKRSPTGEHLEFSSNSIEAFDPLKDNGTIDELQNGDSIRDLRYKLSLYQLDNKQLGTKVKFLEQKLKKSEQHNHDLIQKLALIEVENKRLKFSSGGMEQSFKQIEQEAQLLAEKYEQLVREYNQQETNINAIRVDVHNLKQTCSHLCEFLKQQPTYEQFLSEVESLHEQISGVNWDDPKLAEAISQQLVVVLNLFTQASQFANKAEELDKQLEQSKKESSQTNKTLTESLRAKEKMVEDYHQQQLKLLKEKEELFQQLHQRNLEAMKEMARNQYSSNMPRQMPPLRIQHPQEYSQPYGASVRGQKRSPAVSTRTPYRNNDWQKGRIKDELEQIDSEICSLQSQLMRDMIS